jgi:hypothetical protein
MDIKIMLNLLLVSRVILDLDVIFGLFWFFAQMLNLSYEQNYK